MGWTFPWASSLRGDFNVDFNVWFTEEQQREGTIEYNYRREAVFEWRAGQEGGGEGAEAEFAAMCGTDTVTYHRERPGMSAFAGKPRPVDNSPHHEPERGRRPCVQCA